MRLSDVLSRAPHKTSEQVEGFLGPRRLNWSKNKTIRVGRIALNFYCATCSDVRTFMSGEELSCLVTGDSTVSIDATLRCSACGSLSIDAWFLVASDDDLYAPAPVVHLERYTENRKEPAALAGKGRFEDLLERARIAHDNGLGAGAMVYLRTIFEDITTQVAEVSDIPTRLANGRRVQFRQLLETVNERHGILPQRFATNGYKLFSELSEVIHGAATEEEAMSKFGPCRQLVLGVVDNVRRDQEIARAISALGWDIADGESLAREASRDGEV